MTFGHGHHDFKLRFLRAPCGESARRQRFSLHELPSTRRLAEIPGLNFLTAR